jgi:hypothetical protein
MTTYSDLTIYPKIYKKTYWGQYAETYSQCVEHKAIENRNKFVEEYDIDKYIKNTRIMTKKLEKRFSVINEPNMRHFEVYSLKNKKGYIGLYSPYNSFNDDEYHFNIINSGYTEIYQLYAKNARSYIKIVDKSN